MIKIAFYIVITCITFLHDFKTISLCLKNLEIKIWYYYMYYYIQKYVLRTFLFVLLYFIMFQKLNNSTFKTYFSWIVLQLLYSLISYILFHENKNTKQVKNNMIEYQSQWCFIEFNRFSSTGPGFRACGLQHRVPVVLTPACLYIT